VDKAGVRIEKLQTAKGIQQKLREKKVAKKKEEFYY